MPKMMYYQQKRIDGGVRSAIEIDGATVLERFQKGKKASDPVLVWFVDVRCTGSKLPDDPEKARQWFMDHSAIIRNGIDMLANKLQVGIDVDSWPLIWNIPNAPPGVRMKIVCSAVRRLDLLEIAGVLREVGVGWEENIRGLQEEPAFP